MSGLGGVVVVVDRDPFAATKGQWSRILGVLKHDEISLRWCEASEQTTRKFWKWNLVVCLLDSTKNEAVPVVLCDNAHLAQKVSTFVSLSAGHLREGGFLRLQRGHDVKYDGSLDIYDDVIREALGDAFVSLPLVRVGEIVAVARSQCLREILQGKEVTVAGIRRIVSRLSRIDDDDSTNGTRKRRKKRKAKRVDLQEEQSARTFEFYRLKHGKTYSSTEALKRAVVTPFASRTFAPKLERFYAHRGGHPGYLKTVARYADGLPPWDRVFVEEWAVLGIEVPPPLVDERMVLLQYPNDNGMGYSFATCDAAGIQELICATERPTFSEVYREDMPVTAIPIDWDMPPDKVVGLTWNPFVWLERIKFAAEAALRQLFPALQAVPHEQQVLAQSYMWISEEMMANASPEGCICIKGLDKVTVHANLVLPFNVMLSNYKVLRVIYQEMERQDNSPLPWFLDKSITKLRLPGCLKRCDDGSYVRRLVPWCSTPNDAVNAFVHARHNVPPLEGIDVAVLVLASPKRNNEEYRRHTLSRGCNVPNEEAVDAIRRALSQKEETAAVKLSPTFRPPFVNVRRQANGTNWCVIKGGAHSHATMYFVIESESRAWIHCHSDKCKAKRLTGTTRPYIDLTEARICWQEF